MEKSNSDEDESGTSEKALRKFQFVSSNGLLFQSVEDKKIKCGNCNKEFLRIISHLNNVCKHAIPEEELKQLKQEADKYNQKMRHNKWKAKIELATLHKLKEAQNMCQKKSREKIKSATPHKFKEAQNMRQKKSREKIKSATPHEFKEAQNMRKKKSREKIKLDSKKVDQETSKKNEYYRKSKAIRTATVGSFERLQKFKKAVRFGPIFICSSCHQRLFEREVVPLEESFENEINDKYDGAFSRYEYES